MVDTTKPLTNTFEQPSGFSIHEVTETTAPAIAGLAVAPASLGPLAAFKGTFTGRGFNTIFRPDSSVTPTPMPGPVNTTDPPDNVLELNVTAETMSFSDPLGSVPNRGSKNQADIFLDGVPYLQTVNDVTNPGRSIGIHLEPGLWLQVPGTTNPTEPVTIARLASIPHGTTILAQGIALLPPAPGKPNIAPVDITPFVGGNPNQKVPFQNQTATNKTTRRIPQDLSPQIAAGTITQAILNDPNTVLRNQIANQTITQTTTLLISTKPGKPLPRGPLQGAVPAPTFAGGTANIAFLPAQANPPPGGPNSNADAPQMDAVFWIETVVYDVQVPPMPAGTPPVTLEPVQKGSVPVVPSFIASIPAGSGKGFAGGTVKVPTIQIQYSQKVLLDFAGLSWPHVSVASLVPAQPVPIPESLLPLT